MHLSTNHPTKLFLIEDNVDIRRVFLMLLKLKGYDVEAFDAGAPAILAHRETQPPVSIIDINLPDMDGFQVAREIRKHETQRSVLVALTGSESEISRLRATDAGFDLYYVKPTDIHVLCDSIDQKLGLSEISLKPVSPSVPLAPSSGANVA